MSSCIDVSDYILLLLKYGGILSLPLSYFRMVIFQDILLHCYCVSLRKLLKFN
jgi:hypothetical protein